MGLEHAYSVVLKVGAYLESQRMQKANLETMSPHPGAGRLDQHASALAGKDLMHYTSYHNFEPVNYALRITVLYSAHRRNSPL